MKKKSKLAHLLFTISNVIFWVLLVFTATILLFDTFIKEGKIENFKTTAHHSIGYPVNAKMQFHHPDTLILYYGENIDGNISNYANNETFQKIKNDTALTKTFQINNAFIYDYNDDIASAFYKINKENLIGEINVSILPKDNFFKLILLLKTYLLLFISLFVAYQLRRIFANLKANFSFNFQISNGINCIGYSLIIFQFITTLISIFVKFKVSRINFTHYMPSIKDSMFNYLTLFIEIDFSFISVLLGLSLLLLSKLLVHGTEIQLENDLTL